MSSPIRKIVKSFLQAAHLLGPARRLIALNADGRRIVMLLADAMSAWWGRTIRYRHKSPSVKQELSSLPSIHSDVHDTSLHIQNPKLLSLYERYHARTPYLRITSPLWHHIPHQMDLRNFRDHCGYLWTTESAFRYKTAARYVSRFDQFNLLRLFGEDNAFGCRTYRWNGVDISRDKLDSITEIYYLIRRFGLNVCDQVKVLDIGAGYGRLAHRFTTLFKRAEYYCVDAIPISTFLCEFYLRFRKAKRTHVVPFDQLDTLAQHRFDFAINVHSFPEQTSDSIECWMSLLDSLDLKRLVVVDHTGRWLTMEHPDNHWSCYFPILQKHGWSLIDARPKYETVFGHVFGIYPEAVYALFARA
ncbi:MAG TPA: putative sugar O-methyltransferase [Nitrospiraceae bacterium]|nr:putative sugar O-methyltransferase [Nitrospiraceae bacterium]